MDRDDTTSALVCGLCGEAFALPEEEVEGNLPRVLLCSHIYCTTCLLSVQCDNVIRCPECEVESTLPEGGVFGLQEDSRIIGLIYTSKMNRMKRYDRLKNRKRNKLSPFTNKNMNTEDVEQPVDTEKIAKMVHEALPRGAENLALLEQIHKTLTTGLEEQVKRDRARLEDEIKEAADQASHAVQKWRDLQLAQLKKLEERFSTSQAEVLRVKERMKALEIAMQKARQVCRVPSLKQYCLLDKVLETLQAPVDSESFDMKCITKGSGLSCVFLSENLDQGLSLSLKMEVGSPRKRPTEQPQQKAPPLLDTCKGQEQKLDLTESQEAPNPTKTTAAQPGSQQNAITRLLSDPDTSPQVQPFQPRLHLRPKHRRRDYRGAFNTGRGDRCATDRP